MQHIVSIVGSCDTPQVVQIYPLHETDSGSCTLIKDPERPETWPLAGKIIKLKDDKVFGHWMCGSKNQKLVNMSYGRGRSKPEMK